ncbi:MAG: DUF2079 domain-containing protein [PVC group bacterium]
MESSGILKSSNIFSLLIILLIIVYTVIFSIAGYYQYISFSYRDMDLAAISQAFWNGVHGRFYTASHVGESALFNNHKWLIALPLLPLYVLFPSPVTLLVFQAAALGFGAWGVYLLARHLLNPGWGLLFSFCYLIYPALNFITLYEFHPITFITPLLLFTYYFYIRRKWGIYVLFLLLSLACREDAALPVFGLGVYALIHGMTEGGAPSRDRWKWGLSALLLSAAWFTLCIKIFPFLVAAFFPEADRSNLIPVYFGWLGRSPGVIVRTLIARPGYSLKGILTGPKLLYLFHLLVPFGFLSLFSPSACVMVVFGALEGLLSSRPEHFSIRCQYTALVIPFVLISAMGGIRNLLRWKWFKSRPEYLMIFLLAVSPLSAKMFGPLFRFPDLLRQWRVTEEDLIRRELVRMVPPSAPVLSTFQLASHLSSRPKLFYSFQFCGGWRSPSLKWINVPLVQKSALWMLIDFNDPLTFHYFYGPESDRHLRAFLEENWRLEETVNSLALFRKGASPEIGLIGKAALSEIGNPLSEPVKSVPGLVLRGYSLRPGNRLDFRVVETAVFLQCDGAVKDNYLLGVSFRKQGGGGCSFGQYLFGPFRIFPSSRWEKGDFIGQRCVILVPTEAPAGMYDVALSLVRPLGRDEFAGEVIHTARDALTLP